MEKCNDYKTQWNDIYLENCHIEHQSVSERNMLQVNDAMHSRATFSLSDITNESAAQIVLGGKKQYPMY